MIVEKYPESAFKLFFNLHMIAPVSGLSDEIVCILVAQETAKLSNVKVGGLKKNSAALPALPALHHSSMAQVRVPDFFRLSNFDIW